ncbi:MAG: hypothetical protein MJ211_05820 [Bacteroidales bacterium]|nr:hypothetical protein [Bacteroidales bacterium]
MKQIFAIIMLTFLANFTFAGNGKITVTQGNKNVFNENALVIVEFDYSSTTWEDDDNYKTWSGNDFDERVNLSINAFTNSFKATSKKLKVSENQDAKYKIVVIVENLEQHQSMSTWGRLTMKITGKIQVVEIDTNNLVCELSVKDVKGSPDYTMTDRINKAFCELGALIGEYK